jgi:hypothetical protein
MKQHIPSSSGTLRNTASTPALLGLQRKCACGKHTGARGECEECKKNHVTLQRRPNGFAEQNSAPPIVNEVLRSPGQPLDQATRAFMEPRFGHDFSQVRVHADAQAAESAQALNALAYTAERDIVFGAGRYAPGAFEGRRLLAHELTHVVQQTLLPGQSVPSSNAPEFEARRTSDATASGHLAKVAVAATTGHVQCDEEENPLDAKAKAIIALANDKKIKAAERAEVVVKSIIKEYYSSDQALLHSVEYNNAKAGGGVHAQEKFAPSSKNEESTGIIYVGDTFLEGVNQTHFARRVLQVGHEIEHIHQWRTGLAGGHKGSEREFLSFYHEALLPEKPGTGRMPHSTRLRLIDAALGNYYCLGAGQKKGYEDKKEELLQRRAKEIAVGGTPDTRGAPTECKKSS